MDEAYYWMWGQHPALSYYDHPPLNSWLLSLSSAVFGSIVWGLILLHTVHLVTDFLDTLFLCVFLFTHSVDNERFSDTDDNAGYWAFIVLTWLPYYLLIYWAPRWAP